MASKKFTVDLTFAQINDLAKVIQGAHLDKRWSAERNLADAEAEDAAKVAETGNKHDAYRATSIKLARSEQQRLSDLHDALVGEAREASPENDPKPVDADA